MKCSANNFYGRFSNIQAGTKQTNAEAGSSGERSTGARAHFQQASSVVEGMGQCSHVTVL